jgi:hypothetical protein
VDPWLWCTPVLFLAGAGRRRAVRAHRTTRRVQCGTLLVRKTWGGRSQGPAPRTRLVGCARLIADLLWSRGSGAATGMAVAYAGR